MKLELSKWNYCEDCGSKRPIGNGQMTLLTERRAVIQLWCHNCQRKTWSLPFFLDAEQTQEADK